jgi:hypothetical protein
MDISAIDITVKYNTTIKIIGIHTKICVCNLEFAVALTSSWSFLIIVLYSTLLLLFTSTVDVTTTNITAITQAMYLNDMFKLIYIYKLLFTLYN